jgi:hypothetical protein
MLEMARADFRMGILALGIRIWFAGDIGMMALGG